MFRPVAVTDLAARFRAFFLGSPKHRRDLVKTDIEALEGVTEEQLVAYLERNPIAAWTNTGKDGQRATFFTYNMGAKTLTFNEPRDVAGLDGALRERVAYRLAHYFETRFARRNVFNVINAGQDHGIIMLGADEEAPVPRNEGWKPVEIGGRKMFAKFAKIAINILKDEPTDDSAIPNRLTEVLEELFGPGGYLPMHGNRVRITPSPNQIGAWVIEPQSKRDRDDNVSTDEGDQVGERIRPLGIHKDHDG
jgi:hypothetical protein